MNTNKWAEKLADNTRVSYQYQDTISKSRFWNTHLGGVIGVVLPRPRPWFDGVLLKKEGWAVGVFRFTKTGKAELTVFSTPGAEKRAEKLATKTRTDWTSRHSGLKRS